jgi:hypothetical protein
MNRSQLTRALACTLLAGSALWYSRQPLATDVAAAQQGKTGATLQAVEPDFLSRRADRCGVRAPSAAQQASIDQAEARGKDSGGVVTVPVYWHIITTNSGGGNVASLVPAQMQVLNDAFSGSRFVFELQDVQVVANSTWFLAVAESAEEVAMKTALRRGGPNALNIYTTNGDVYLGWATLPFFYKFAPAYDGVVLWWAALPGTGLSGASDDEPDGVLTYDQGDTATHEVGHWLGLYHTFASGGCTHPGDKIKDTPTEALPQFFCAPRDSCVGSPFRGEDPIMNFMDYVDDVCMDHFTPGQTSRMQKQWHAFRDKKGR